MAIPSTRDMLFEHDSVMLDDGSVITVCAVITGWGRFEADNWFDAYWAAVYDKARG